MEPTSLKRQLIERFGEAIARIHEQSFRSLTQSIENLHDPRTEHDHAVAAYYRDMDRDTLIVSLAQTAIERTLHDFLFLFDQNDEFKLILETEHGEKINLAQEVDVIQAFPGNWIEKKSSAGLESARLVDFISEAMNLGETREERRARILAAKDKK